MATTVIENGIDMPNVNTIIVYLADRCALLNIHVYVCIPLTAYVVLLVYYSMN